MIENDLKASPYIREAIVCGDGRKFLCCLIGIELDTVGEWAQRRQLGYSTYRDLSEKEEVVELVAGIVQDVNGRLASVEQVKQFRLLPRSSTTRTASSPRPRRSSARRSRRCSRTRSRRCTRGVRQR